MDIQAAINDFDNILTPKIVEFINEIMPWAMSLAVGIMFFFVGYKVMKNMANPEERLDPYTIVQPVLVLGAMVLYKELAELLLFKPIEIVSQIITESAHRISGRSLADFELAFQGAITHVQINGADGSGVYDIVQINPFLEIIHLLIYFVASVIGGYIILRQLIIKQIYYILGVFVLPFSLIVGNQKVLGTWFFGFISILLWIPILDILKMIIILLPVETTDFTDVLFSVVLQIVMIFAILKVPSFANMLVSEGSSIGGKAGSSIKGALANSPSAALKSVTNRMSRRKSSANSATT